MSRSTPAITWGVWMNQTLLLVILAGRWGRELLKIRCDSDGTRNSPVTKHTERSSVTK